MEMSRSLLRRHRTASRQSPPGPGTGTREKTGGMTAVPAQTLPGPAARLGCPLAVRMRSRTMSAASLRLCGGLSAGLVPVLSPVT